MTEKEMLTMLERALSPLNDTMQSLSSEVKGTNRRLDALSAEMDGLKAEVGTLRDEVNGVKAEVGAFKEEVHAELDTLHGEVNGLKAEVGTLQDGVNGVRVILESKISREIQLLSEGHEAIAARLPDPEAQEALEERVSVVEAVVRFQGEQIQELKKAQ